MICKALMIVIILYVLLLSMFCMVMKEKGICNDSIENSVENKEIKQKTERKIKKMCFKLMNDSCFLCFKVIGYIPCHAIRLFFYKYVFKMNLGKRVVIYYGLEARSPWNISIGDGTIVGDHAILDARYGIEIGQNVNVSTGAWMWTLQHDVNSKSFGVEGKGGKIIIGNRAWISSRTSILPGVQVAEGVVLACGAVATSNCSISFGIYGGIPAKMLGMRNKEIDYCLDGTHRIFL